jgi:hypothetical protein
MWHAFSHMLAPQQQAHGWFTGLMLSIPQVGQMASVLMIFTVLAHHEAPKTHYQFSVLWWKEVGEGIERGNLTKSMQTYLCMLYNMPFLFPFL